jgi:hypothetical protein
LWAGRVEGGGRNIFSQRSRAKAHCACPGVGLGVDSRDGPDGIVRSSWLVHSSASSTSCATFFLFLAPPSELKTFGFRLIVVYYHVN